MDFDTFKRMAHARGYDVSIEAHLDDPDAPQGFGVHRRFDGIKLIPDILLDDAQLEALTIEDFREMLDEKCGRGMHHMRHKCSQPLLRLMVITELSIDQLISGHGFFEASKSHVEYRNPLAGPDSAVLAYCPNCKMILEELDITEIPDTEMDLKGSIERVINIQYQSDQYIDAITQGQYIGLEKHLPGVTTYDIGTKGRQCNHTPPCSWSYKAFCYGSVIVVVPFEMMYKISVGNLIKALKTPMGEWKGD